MAREKRERMRSHLYQAILAAVSQCDHGGLPVIDDVIRHADVSRGTFYKYFASVDQAVSELALSLADEMTENISIVYDVLDEPIRRTATGFQTFLARSLIDPNWGAFITHIGLLSGENNLFGSKIKSDIRMGVETGDYMLSSVDLATDLLMGAKIEAIRRIIGGERDPGYIRGMAELVLRSFGVAPGKAAENVRWTYDRLHAEAPGRLNWWRPLH